MYIYTHIPCKFEERKKKKPDRNKKKYIEMRLSSFYFNVTFVIVVGLFIILFENLTKKKLEEERRNELEFFSPK